MKKSFGTILLGSSIFILALAGSGLAKTKMEAKSIQILYPTQLAGGTTLKPGTYRVELLTNSKSPELSFYQHQKQVAETPVKLVPSQTRNRQTEVQYDTASNAHVITEIDFRGDNQRMLLGKSITR